MKCPSCGADNRDEVKFCVRCGAQTGRVCGHCGAVLKPEERFCGSCGKDSMGGSKPGPSRPSPTHTVALGPLDLEHGRYRVIRTLGEGSSKIVYLARDTALDRNVAISILKTDGLDESGRARLRRETRAMGQLGDHPHIVSIYNVAEDRGRPYVVTQYMGGGSVEELLQNAPDHRLSVERAARIGSGVCEALEFAHERGILHRDVKPANVWLSEDGDAKLGDFGLAVMPGGSRLTQAGTIIGTVAYMPPEQALGKTVDARSDLYSLGAMLYELVTGRPPFIGTDLAGIISQHLNVKPEPPSTLASGIPPALDNIILKLLAKKPEDRPASARAVYGELAAMIDKAKGGDKPPVNTHAAPDGTSAILFSDMENSTTMYERLGDLRAHEMLQIHNSIIRDQVAKFQGYEVKQTGDGFMVLFSSAHRALLCAIGIQRAFAEHSKNHPEAALRVRLGLHVGEAIKEEDGDYHGNAVNFAARVMSKGEGGQILVSSTFKVVAASFGDVAFDEGRDVELKGLSGVHRVYCAIWDSNDTRNCPACSRLIASTLQTCPHCSTQTGANPTLPGGSSSSRKSIANTITAGATQTIRRARHPLVMSACGLSIVIAGAFFYMHIRSGEQADQAASSLVPVSAPAAPNFAAQHRSSTATAKIIVREADRVLGQSNMTANGAGVALNRMNTPEAVLIDQLNHLYIADTGNDRILIWNDASHAATGVPADTAIGRPPAGEGQACSSAPADLCAPQSIAMDAHGRMFVADTEKNRIVIYNSPLKKHDAPDLVLDGDCTPSENPQTFCQPTSISVDRTGAVYVSDRSLSRVFMYSTLPAKSIGKFFGEEARIKKCHVDKDNLCRPHATALEDTPDHVSLYVADTGNNRVVSYDDALGSDADADRVLGQPNRRSRSAGTGLDQLNTPKGLAFDPARHRLYVADTRNNRVLAWNQAEEADRGAPADLVIGSADSQPTVSGSTLHSPRGLAVDRDGDLFVTDKHNNRVLVYRVSTLFRTEGAGQQAQR